MLFFATRLVSKRESHLGTEITVKGHSNYLIYCKNNVEINKLIITARCEHKQQQN